ncbi:MAG: demethoxyubiquinone hydroxylase family protein [Pseudomonadota bacterium]
MNNVPAFGALPLDYDMVAELRSDHAGECGAVQIYAGILSVSRHPEVRRFARQHIRTEIRHRRFFDRWLPDAHKSRLIRVWNLAGWLLGATSALFGARAVFATIEAVETFVESHYLAQIHRMREIPALRDLVRVLQAFCDDEVEHQHDAAARLHRPSGAVGRAWSSFVGAGSAAGVLIAKRV